MPRIPQIRISPHPETYSFKPGPQERKLMKQETRGDPRVSFDTFGGKARTSYPIQQMSEIHPFSASQLRNEASRRATANGDVYLDTKKAALDYVATPGHRAAALERTKTLDTRAHDKINGFDYGPYNRDVAAPQNAMRAQMTGMNAQRSAEYLLRDRDFKGVVIGENHTERHGKQFLADNMPSLKANGVNTLYLEHFRHNEYQPMIDKYMAAPGARVSGPLGKAVDRMDGPTAGRNGLRGILETAKANDVRVVGIDDIYAKDSSHPSPGVVRTARMNTLAHDIITNDAARANGKYMALVGSAHSNTHAGGIPGLSQMLNIPATQVPHAGGPLELHSENPAHRNP